MCVSVFACLVACCVCVCVFSCAISCKMRNDGGSSNWRRSASGRQRSGQSRKRRGDGGRRRGPDGRRRKRSVCLWKMWNVEHSESSVVAEVVSQSGPVRPGVWWRWSTDTQPSLSRFQSALRQAFTPEQPSLNQWFPNYFCCISFFFFGDSYFQPPGKLLLLPFQNDSFVFIPVCTP